MIGYEFYWCDAIEGYKFIGMIPEMRRDLKRITHKSILNLGRMLVGEKAGDQNIFFILTRKDETTGGILRTTSPLSNGKRV
jgi:hypothetical protein